MKRTIQILVAVLATAVVIAGLVGVLGDSRSHSGTPAAHQASAAPAVGEAAAPDGASASASASPSPVAHSAASPGTPQNKYELLRARIMPMFQAQGHQAALDDLELAIDEVPSFTGVCHSVAHELGHAAYDASNRDAGSLLNAKLDVCGAGFLHGVVERALETAPDPEAELLNVCLPNMLASCIHGTGHGVYMQTKGDLQRSIELCNSYGASQNIGWCAEGLMMQMWDNDVAAGHMAGKKRTTPDTALQVCPQQSGVYQGACWFYASTLLLNGKDEDWPNVAQWCANLPDGSAASNCAMGAGSRAVKYSIDDIDKAAERCAMMPGNLVYSCNRGMGSYWSVDSFGELPQSDVCNQMTDPAYISTCRGTFGT
jgi:hypothetical protein